MKSSDRLLRGALFALITTSTLSAQINIADSVFSIEYSFEGAFYDDGPDDASFDVEMYLSEAWTATEEGSGSASLSYEGAPIDFEFGDTFLSPGDRFQVEVSASAMAGPGTTDSSTWEHVTPVYGYLYGDSESYEFITVVFNYTWTWDWSVAEHPSPAGNSTATLASGYRVDFDGGLGVVLASDAGEPYESDPNFIVIPGIEPQSEPYNLGVGGTLLDGTLYSFQENGSGTIQVRFPIDGFDASFEFRSLVEAYADMDIGVIPEASSGFFALALGLFPFLRRRR